MSIVFAILGLILALAVALGHRIHDRLPAGAVLAAWASVLVGLGTAYAGHLNEVGGALAIAALAVVAVTPGRVRTQGVRQPGAAPTAWLAVLLAVIGLMNSGDAAGGALSSVWTLVVARWAALAAAIGAAAAASTVIAARQAEATPRWSAAPGAALALIAAGATIGVAVIGHLRAMVPGTVYGLPLSSGEGPVVWQVPGPTGASLVRIEAMLTIEWMMPVLAAMVILVAGAAVMWHLRRNARLSGVLWGATGLVGGGALGGLLSAAQGATLPVAQAYERLGQRLLQAQDLPVQLANQGRFVTDGDPFVRLADLGPEILGLGLVAGLAFWSAWQMLREHGQPVEVERSALASLAARDLGVQAIVFGWLAWTIAALLRWHVLGTPGVNAPAEWIDTGVMCLVTAVVLLSWRTHHRGASPEFTLTPGIIGALLLIGTALHYAFGASVGIGLPN